MRNILKYGCYSVGASARVAVQSVHDLISMRLEERDKKLLKKVYTLDELRDLESKLVLICGNKEESRTEVDHFLNVSCIHCIKITVSELHASDSDSLRSETFNGEVSALASKKCITI